MTEEKRFVTSQKSVVFYDIFIAGPGDVSKERLYIRDKILLWTRDNAETTGIHLRPRMWELDSPGGAWLKDPKRPEKNSSQWIIDEKVVKRCSFLVAVFADRLGTPPDDKYPSGTAREIDIHVSAGKPSKIFFCESPYEGADVERLKERQRLDEYRRKIERREFRWIAAYHTYQRKKFRARFDRQFVLMIEEIELQAAHEPALLVNCRSQFQRQLSECEIAVLKYAIKNRNGIFETREIDGKFLIASIDRERATIFLNSDGDDDSNAEYEYAVKNLIKAWGYVEINRKISLPRTRYKLTLQGRKAIKEILADDLTRAPKTTGNPDDSK